MSGGKEGGKGGGSNQTARHSTGTLTNDKIDCKKGGKGGTKKELQAAEDAANEAIVAAMVEGEIMTPDSGGKGTTPEHEPPAAAAQSRSNAGEVSKMQRQIAELRVEAPLAEKGSKVTDDL